MLFNLSSLCNVGIKHTRSNGDSFKLIVESFPCILKRDANIKCVMTRKKVKTYTYNNCNVHIYIYDRSND